MKRKNELYLVNTLRGLCDGLQGSDKNHVEILVFLSDIEQEAIESVSTTILSEFRHEVNTGLIKVIRAPVSYYPSLDGLPVLWKDSPKRVKWRSKQCLDYAFLFNYVYNNYTTKYYLHIEDDLLIDKGYLKYIKSFITKNQEESWSILEFSKSIGFIGWLYRTSDLGYLAKFIRTYYWSLPVDMLCRHYNEFHLYGNPSWAVHYPSIFHHAGQYSSLDGVTRTATVIPPKKYRNHSNPEAAITTSIKTAMPNKYTDIT